MNKSDFNINDFLVLHEGNHNNRGNPHSQYALKKDFKISKTTNGYTILPNNLLVQWGRNVLENQANTLSLPNSKNSTTIILPQAYSENSFVPIVTVRAYNSNYKPIQAYLGTVTSNKTQIYIEYLLTEDCRYLTFEYIIMGV